MKKKDPNSHRVIEKRRRDRMNNCLADLSKLIPTHYMKKGRARVEKTEIIEMAIKHLKDLNSMMHIGQQLEPSQQQDCPLAGASTPQLPSINTGSSEFNLKHFSTVGHRLAPINLNTDGSSSDTGISSGNCSSDDATSNKRSSSLANQSSTGDSNSSQTSVASSTSSPISHNGSASSGQLMVDCGCSCLSSQASQSPEQRPAREPADQPAQVLAGCNLSQLNPSAWYKKAWLVRSISRSAFR